MKMEKTNYKILLLLLCILITINLAYAETDTTSCALSASLVNQDPYPAIPGEYVDVLFQIDGISASCENGAAIDLILDYPFSLDSGISSRSIKSNTYAGYGYDSSWNSVYKLRVDENAIPGDYTLELRYKSGSELNWNTYSFKKFNITIEGGKTDFEVHIENYKILDKTITFEILNSGDQNIRALTVELPKQDNIIVKGSNRNIVGDLDSNEYTTADFEATPTEGEIILNLYYTDPINERRMVRETVYYDPNYFIGSIENTAPSKTNSYIITGVIVVLVVLFFFRRHRNKKKQKAKKNFDI